MSKVKLIWIASFILTILLFIDDIAGVDTEDAGGMVIANEGVISGKYSWPLLTISVCIFILCSLILIIKLVLKPKHK